MTLTIQILVKNNESTIEHTLNSISNLKANIVIGDLGCKDETLKICKKFDAEIIPISLNKNLSQARNFLLDKTNSKWNLFIEPHEIMFRGENWILEAIKREPKAYNFSIIQGDSISKQIRLWHKSLNLKFENPVFERLEYKEKLDSEVYILSGEKDVDLILDLSINWMESQPLTNQPVYYVACANLIKKNWESFLNYAEIYLHQETKNSMSSIMTKYYYAMVKLYIKKDYQSAIKNLLHCIAEKPLMAEFWCLLADIYYAINQVEKAQSFYENAIILGSRRLKNDEYPMEISKYKEYPEKMLKACSNILESSKIYLEKKTSE